METRFKKDQQAIEKEWFDEELPIGGIGIVVLSFITAALLAMTYEWASFTFLDGFQTVLLLLGFAAYFGRQWFDLPWLYLVLSYKERYQTQVEQQNIAYGVTKHIARMSYLVILVPVLYFFGDKPHPFWSVPVIASFFVFPIVYRIFANKAETRVEEQLKKTPIQRISADGKIDLSHLPFVFENLEAHGMHDEKVKKAYVTIQSLLDYVTRRVALIEDVEIVHTLKRMGEEELPRLLHEYEALDAELQQAYVKKVLSYLSLLEQKLKTYKDVIDAKKTQNIQTTFSLLDERYRG